MNSIAAHKYSEEKLCHSHLGARSQSASVLSSLQEVKDVQDNLNDKEAQLKDIEKQLASLKGTAEKYVNLKMPAFVEAMCVFKCEIYIVILIKGLLALLSTNTQHGNHS